MSLLYGSSPSAVIHSYPISGTSRKLEIVSRNWLSGTNGRWFILLYGFGNLFISNFTTLEVYMSSIKMKEIVSRNWLSGTSGRWFILLYGFRNLFISNFTTLEVYMSSIRMKEINKHFRLIDFQPH